MTSLNTTPTPTGTGSPAAVVAGEPDASVSVFLGGNFVDVFFLIYFLPIGS